MYHDILNFLFALTRYVQLNIVHDRSQVIPKKCQNVRDKRYEHPQPAPHPLVLPSN